MLELERIRQTAEFAHLREHLQPHFLRNTLNAIVALVTKDPLARSPEFLGRSWRSSWTLSTTLPRFERRPRRLPLINPLRVVELEREAGETSLLVGVVEGSEKMGVRVSVANERSVAVRDALYGWPHARCGENAFTTWGNAASMPAMLLLVVRCSYLPPSFAFGVALGPGLTGTDDRLCDKGFLQRLLSAGRASAARGGGRLSKLAHGAPRFRGASLGAQLGIQNRSHQQSGIRSPHPHEDLRVRGLGSEDDTPDLNRPVDFALNCTDPKRTLEKHCK